MPKSSKCLTLDKRRRTYVRLIGRIRDVLNQAFAEEAETRQLTRAAMAQVLGADKSFISRKLNGTSNMTLETLADLAYALDRVVDVQLLSRVPKAGSNHGYEFSPAKIEVASGDEAAELHSPKKDIDLEMSVA